jgi:DNA polymerase elongation subunit (family B)
MRLVTWNGNGFDLPFIYKRAMILGVNPANFNAPPLSAWTKRYNTDRHYDLMQVWGGWSAGSFEKLGTVAAMVLGEKKVDVDVSTFAELLKTEAGRKIISERCLGDARLTLSLFRRMDGCLFAGASEEKGRG